MLIQKEIINNLQQLFELEEYATAAQVIENVREIPEIYNEIVAIYDATLCLRNNNYSQMWNAIHTGLSCDCKNSELYILLGEYYLPKNPNQAYLCFENALLHCVDVEDRATIQGYIDTLKEHHDITVRKTSIIVITDNQSIYTENCLASIQKNTLKSTTEIVFVDNIAENDNIKAVSEENDIFLLSNDTYLPPNALFWLRMGLYENDSYGTVGSISNYAGNLQGVPFPENTTQLDLLHFAETNNLPMEHPYEEKLYLRSFALLIRRDVYNKIGTLDDCFWPGYYQDGDYGLRVLAAGYKNILCYNSFIICYGVKKDNYQNTGVSELNADEFIKKWQCDIRYYFQVRRELVSLIKEPSEAPLKILDIGCGCGVLDLYIKGGKQFPNATTYGVEIVPAAANIAKHVTNVICGDIEKLEFPWPEDFFDYIIMGDVLEHLHNPSAVLKKLYKHLKNTGHIITSMPNMKHYTVMLPLIVSDSFTYTEAGILDNTHVKMYTGTEIKKLIINTGYNIEECTNAYINSPNQEELRLIDILAQLSRSKSREPYLVYQYIIKAGKCNSRKAIETSK